MRAFSRRSLLSFILTCLSNFSRIKETHKCTSFAKWGVESLKAPSCGISNPVLTASRVKTSIIVHGLYTYQGLYFCVPSFR